MCGNMLFIDPQKSWLLIGRAKLISTNGPSFTFCTQPFAVLRYYFELELLGLQPISFPFTLDRGLFVQPMSNQMSDGTQPIVNE